MPQKVHRVDVGVRIRADQRTIQGGAKIPAALARTGVQNYPQADGTVRREYRPAAEVFAPESLHTFDTATVVIGHPATIDPANWKEHAVGDIRAPHRDGKFVAADLVIRDKATLDRIDSGELQELSCGYDCMLEMTPGTSPEGEKYDAIQRSITINHVGLGPSNWGRAGSEVRLRLDGGGVAYVEDEIARPRPPGMLTEAEIKALQDKAAKADAAEARAVAAEAKLGTRTDADVATLQAKLDEATDKTKKLEALTSPTHVDTIVRARMTVLDGARLLHGKDVENKGSDREIQIAAIVARDPEFKADGRSDDYVRARFDVKVEDAKRAGASLANLNAGTSPAHLDGGAGTTDANDAEFAELCKHFDAAPDLLENYHRAQPWLYGETAAAEAAQKASGG